MSLFENGFILFRILEAKNEPDFDAKNLTNFKGRNLTGISSVLKM
jgi:hypothetical protein